VSSSHRSRSHRRRCNPLSAARASQPAAPSGLLTSARPALVRRFMMLVAFMLRMQRPTPQLTSGKPGSSSSHADEPPPPPPAPGVD